MEMIMRVETRLAVIERHEGSLVKTRFKDGVDISMEGMRENIAQRRVLCGDEPHVMLTVIPANANFDNDMMLADMFKYDGLRANIVAIAVVAMSPMVDMVMKLYFSYFPQVFHTQVFSREEDALVWLGRMKQELVLARS